MKTLLNLPPLGDDPAELRRRAALVASLRGPARPGVSAPMTTAEAAGLRGTRAEWNRWMWDGDPRPNPYAQLVGRRA